MINENKCFNNSFNKTAVYKGYRYALRTVSENFDGAFCENNSRLLAKNFNVDILQGPKYAFGLRAVV